MEKIFLKFNRPQDMNKSRDILERLGWECKVSDKTHFLLEVSQEYSFNEFELLTTLDEIEVVVDTFESREEFINSL